jgi:HPt (histidine-containing phosphotransfer) domain-containing protein
MTTAAPAYLSTDKTAAFIGTSAGVTRLLNTLKDTLDTDLPQLRLRLAAGDVKGVNDLLHQFKGFVPVFCVDSLVDLVCQVEALGQQAPIASLQSAMVPLLEQLTVLHGEVQRQLEASTCKH